MLPETQFDHHALNHHNNNINDGNVNSENPVRIYLDGCWDVMHSGHYNAIRQAKQLGGILIVGVHSDEEIAKHKRYPVMNNEERLAAVRSCKWVDEVVFDVPYVATPDLLDREDIRADYVAHGDDIPYAANGESAYSTVMNRLKIFKRTPGVSTTGLINRLLQATHEDVLNRKKFIEKEKIEQTQLQIQQEDDEENNQEQIKQIEQIEQEQEQLQGQQNEEPEQQEQSKDQLQQQILYEKSWSQFLATSHRLSVFSNQKIPKPNDKIVYIDGVFDLFHIGHINILKKAKLLGDFLYVGLHDDNNISKHKNNNFYPIMNLQERTLNVLSCKYVDEVVIGCPWYITQDIINSLNISIVTISPYTMITPENINNELKRFNYCKKLNILKNIDIDINHDHLLTTDHLVQRICDNHLQYSQQNHHRIKKEKSYLEQQSKVYVQES